jgi:hypothetical protein
VPVVGTVPGGDDDRAGRGPAGVSILVRGANREFLEAIRREVLQEAADPVVGVIGAIDGEFVVQTRASTGGDGGDARLGRVGVPGTIYAILAKLRAGNGKV